MIVIIVELWQFICNMLVFRLDVCDFVDAELGNELYEWQCRLSSSE